MLRSVSLSLINCFLILLTIVLHKILYRVMLWDYQNLIKYWGVFILIFFILNIFLNMIFSQRKDSSKLSN